MFRYGIAIGKAEHDITADLRGALAPHKGKHFASITDPRQVGQLLRAIDGYQGDFVTSSALKIAPLVFVRECGVRASYNFAEFLPERRKMMQAWADYLDELKSNMSR